MVKLPIGAATLYHWTRILRSRSRAAPIDRAKTWQALSKTRPDLACLVKTVRHDGVVAVPGYWDSTRCSEGVGEMDRLLAEHPDAIQVSSGGADQRLFGVESASPLLEQFHADAFARGFAELIGGLDIYNFATLGARIEAKETNRGSGDGWHRDAQGFQFKAILYLTDTNLENGPFQYLIGSHRMWRAAADSMAAQSSDARQTRFSDDEIARLAGRGAELRPFPARAGTLLLVNTAGIHRGMPLKTGARYALTNYYYHRIEIDEARVRKFSPMVPGTAERIRREVAAAH